jgi:serine/threonine protein kinase
MKLGDFGVSRRLGPEESHSESSVGTEKYWAPECFRDSGAYRAAADIWSLGCVLYELIMLQSAVRDDCLIMNTWLYDRIEIYYFSFYVQFSGCKVTLQNTILSGAFKCVDDDRASEQLCRLLDEILHVDET